MDDARATLHSLLLMADDDTLRARVREAVAAGYPILKVKLGSDRESPRAVSHKNYYLTIPSSFPENDHIVRFCLPAQ